MIDRFKGKYAFLSNFATVWIKYDGIYYTSVESAFQAQKCIDPEMKIWFSVCDSPLDAKHMGRLVACVPNWENIKVGIMKDLLLLKFSRPDMRYLLMQTKGEELIEGNYHHDTFWGVCNGTGRNMLGKLLMEVRDSVQTI